MNELQLWPIEVVHGGITRGIVTGRNEVLAKVIFSQASVIHSVHRGGSSKFSGVGVSFFGGVPPNFQGGVFFLGGPPIFGGGVFLGGNTYSTGIRSTFGRYASYWNAFLFHIAVLLYGSGIDTLLVDICRLMITYATNVPNIYKIHVRHETYLKSIKYTYATNVPLLSTKYTFTPKTHRSLFSN